MKVETKGHELLNIARKSLENSFHDVAIKVDKLIQHDEDYISGIFVTLTFEGKLRGCKGCFDGDYPLRKTIWSIARSSDLKTVGLLHSKRMNWKD